MIDVTVSLQTKLEKSPFYFAVLHWIDPIIKKDKYKWKTTKVKYIDESQKRLHKQAEQNANNKAEQIRKAFEDELNISPAEENALIVLDRADQKFSDYLRNWANGQKGKKEDTTSAQYITNINNIIAPYFDEIGVSLKELLPIHIQGFYDTQYQRILTKGKNKGKTVSKNTVNHYHQNIHKALSDAVKLDIIPYNPDDKTLVEAPDDYTAEYYTESEAMELLDKVQGHFLELIISIATCYGLRRSEIIGLKWTAFDFKNNTFTIRHKVTQATVDNKRVLVKKDKMKNKSSYRSLPLIPIVRNLLLKEKARQDKNRLLYGNTYQNKEGYICVKDDGELMKPDTVSDQVPEFIVKVGLKRITLHNLRHSCASILLANGISMKEIQEWLGHSSYNTTANIYTHIDAASKQNSANTINNVFSQKISA